MNTTAAQAVELGGRVSPTPHQPFDGLPAFEVA